jgi:transposase
LNRRGCETPHCSFLISFVSAIHEPEYGSEWAATRSIAEKIGCSLETLRTWVRRTQVDAGDRPGVTSDERARMMELEKEVREIRRANEIIRKASAYFAQAELDR